MNGKAVVACGLLVCLFLGVSALGLLGIGAGVAYWQSSPACSGGQCPAPVAISPADQFSSYSIGSLGSMLTALTPAPMAGDGVTVNVPPSHRQRNWGGGSCVHASLVTLLNWNGLYDVAEWWRNEYRGGESIERLSKRMDAAGLRFAYVTDGDVSFLQQCCDTRCGAVITYKPNHAINLVGLDSQYAYLLDNNATSRPEQSGWEQVPRDEFERRWRGYGGRAATVVYRPPAPVPVTY